MNHHTQSSFKVKQPARSVPGKNIIRVYFRAKQLPRIRFFISTLAKSRQAWIKLRNRYRCQRISGIPLPAADACYTIPSTFRLQHRTPCFFSGWMLQECKQYDRTELDDCCADWCYCFAKTFRIAINSTEEATQHGSATWRQAWFICPELLVARRRAEGISIEYRALSVIQFPVKNDSEGKGENSGTWIITE